MSNFYDFLLALIFIGIAIYFIYSTYKKPDPNFFSTDMKGYGAGILFFMLGIAGLLGKFSILEMLKKIFHMN